jgi:hypothetical protein
MAGFTDETGLHEGTLDDIFTFQTTDEAQVARMNNIRREALILAKRIQDECPEDYQRSVAIQRVREAVMWANAAICLQGKV